MFAAIFFQEMLVAARRQRSYFLRWIYATILLVQLVPRLLVTLFHSDSRASLGLFANFFGAFTVQHFFYLLALTPALACGAIADEKVLGTLDHLLTSCLHPVEIVFGKLLSRVCQVFAVTLVALPIAAFFGMVGGLDIPFIAVMFLASAVLIVGIAGISLLASVWCSRTRDAVLCTYLVLVAAFVLAAAIRALGWDGPAEALRPWHVIAADAEDRGGLFAIFAVTWLAPAAVCLALASWRLRAAAARPVSKPRRLAWLWRRTRTVPENANPLFWRERCVHGIAPVAILRALPVWLAAPAVMLTCAAGLAVPILLQVPGNVDLLAIFDDEGIAGLHETFRMNGIRGWDVAAAHGGIALFVLTLLVAVRASGSITEARERKTWDALLLTPLTTHEIVRGTFWGLLAAWLPYLIAYAAGTIPVALFVGIDVALTAVLATGTMVVFTPWVAAVGIWASGLMTSSWRSLLATLGVCYAYYILGNTAVFIPSCIFSWFIAVFVMIAALIVLGPNQGNRAGDIMLFCLAFANGATMLLLNAVIVGATSWGLLSWARQRIDKKERAVVSRSEQDVMQMVPRLQRIADELAEEARADVPGADRR